MEMRRMEKLNIEVSLLGFGAMRFPLNEQGEIDFEKSQKMIDYSFEQGVNYFDTSVVYHFGKSEPFLGEALKKYERSSYYLATKMSVWTIKNKEEARACFHQQLKDLNTDYIDFYLLHSLDRKKWDFILKHDIIGLVDELRAEGKIRYIGFSFHDEFPMFEEIMHYRTWDFCQIQLNYMDTHEQAGMAGYRLAEELEIPMVIMEPIRGGALANFSDDINQKFYDVNPDKTISSYALRYLAQLPNVKVILSGMTMMEHVQDNLQTLSPSVPFTKEEAEVVEEVKLILQQKIQNNCTGCNYCMPCPHGVDIPENFKLWNLYHIYENAGTEYRLGELEQKQATSEYCVSCRACEPKCPQQIPIAKHLNIVTEEMKAFKSTL